MSEQILLLEEYLPKGKYMGKSSTILVYVFAQSLLKKVVFCQRLLGLSVPMLSLLCHDLRFPSLGARSFAEEISSGSCRLRLSVAQGRPSICFVIN